jgi:hypothetical protein
MKQLLLSNIPTTVKLPNFRLNQFPKNIVRKNGLGNILQQPKLFIKVQSSTPPEIKKVLEISEGGGNNVTEKITQKTDPVDTGWGRHILARQKNLKKQLLIDKTAFQKTRKMSNSKRKAESSNGFKSKKRAKFSVSS